MSSHGNGQQVPFDVQMSLKTKGIVWHLYQQAVLAGEGSRFLAAYRQIIEKLRDDPLTFGEPLYRLPALRLLVRQGAVRPLLVDYGVHEELPLVFIRDFKVLS